MHAIRRTYIDTYKNTHANVRMGSHGTREEALNQGSSVHVNIPVSLFLYSVQFWNLVILVCWIICNIHGRAFILDHVCPSSWYGYKNNYVLFCVFRIKSSNFTYSTILIFETTTVFFWNYVLSSRVVIEQVNCFLFVNKLPAIKQRKIQIQINRLCLRTHARHMHAHRHTLLEIFVA